MSCIGLNPSRPQSRHLAGAFCKLRDGEDLDGLLDSRVRVNGYYSLAAGGRRIFSDPFLLVERPQDITVIRSDSEVFAVPKLNAIWAGADPKKLLCIVSA